MRWQAVADFFGFSTQREAETVFMISRYSAEDAATETGDYATERQQVMRKIRKELLNRRVIDVARNRELAHIEGMPE